MGPTVEACTSRALPYSKSAILLPSSRKSKKMPPRKRETSQIHTNGPFSCPSMLKGYQQRKNNSSLSLDTDTSVLSYASRRCTEGQTPSNPAYQEWIWPSRGHAHNMAVPYLLSGTIVNTTSLTDINNIEILRVDLNGISVTSVYKPPGERFSFHQPLTAVGAGDYWGLQQPQFDMALCYD